MVGQHYLHLNILGNSSSVTYLPLWVSLHLVPHDLPLISRSGQQHNIHTQQQGTKQLRSPFQLALEKLRAVAEKILK